MMPLAIALLGFHLVGTAHALEVTGDLAPPAAAGISFEELLKLGDHADAELIKRFSDPRNEQHRQGLLQRMAAFGNLKKPNPRILSGLKSFVEHEVTACTGQVASDRIWMIGSALELIGQRGGAAGAEYLKSWIKDESVYGRIKCFSETRAVTDSQENLRKRALMGLGWSGTKDSLEFLSSVARHPPVVKFPGSLMGVINTAIAINTEIQKNGIENVVKFNRDSMLSYGKQPEYDK